MLCVPYSVRYLVCVCVGGGGVESMQMRAARWIPVPAPENLCGLERVLWWYGTETRASKPFLKIGQNSFFATGIMPRGTTGDLNGSLATLQGDLCKIKYGVDLDVHRWSPTPSRLSVSKYWRESTVVRPCSALDLGEGQPGLPLAVAGNSG